MKTKGMKEAQFLQLLQKVLPKATKDPHLATEIYNVIEKEVRMHKSIAAFEDFCENGGLPDNEPNTVKEFQANLVETFGEENVVVTPAEEGKGLDVEIVLEERTLNTVVKVDPSVLEEEVKVPFVPFPVNLPEDPHLIWVLARQEDLGPDEAARALSLIEEEFWATKKGQDLQRKGTEKHFSEFIIHVPASALKDSGLKRHYKTPETLKSLRLLEAVEENAAQRVGA